MGSLKVEKNLTIHFETFDRMEGNERADYSIAPHKAFELSTEGTGFRMRWCEGYYTEEYDQERVFH